MSDARRPVYVGFGTCDRGCIDMRLYKVPGTALEYAMLCRRCLPAHGYEVPRSRTAEDLEIVDGELAWKKES